VKVSLQERIVNTRQQSSQQGTANSRAFIFSDSSALDSNVVRAINQRFLADETELVRELADLARIEPDAVAKVRETATSLVRSVRQNRKRVSGLDAFLQEYDLSSQEGVVLMCLAEALLRVPDTETADRLIADKLTSADWRSHLGTSGSMFVNASTWGLMLTGRIVRPARRDVDQPERFMQRLVSRLGEPVVRTAVRQAMRIMGHQFVMGRTIGSALKRAAAGDGAQYRFSFDMLGEAALTAEDSQRYLEAYHAGIQAIAAADRQPESIFAADSISVKLSALFPRYEFAKRDRVLTELTPKILELAVAARKAGVGLTVDAEESDRLQISLELFERVFRDQALDGWDGLGLAVQSYLKRGLDACRWVIALAGETGRCIPVRLVKGAYWDAEIKRAQENGLSNYPVFTRKVNSDVAFLACARELLAAREKVYAQFATHNAHSVASVIHFAGDYRQFEFQRLHGMGEELYAEVIGGDKFDLPCRIYAPVGNHEDLLPYLVRRLLENGSNTSFVNRIVDEQAPIEEIVSDPVAAVDGLATVPHPRIPLPADLFGGERANSRGLNLTDPAELGELGAAMDQALTGAHRARPVIGGREEAGKARSVRAPADHGHELGQAEWASPDQARQALAMAASAQPRWDAAGAGFRADLLDRAANLFEEHSAELLALCIREGGRTLPDSISELREAVDFLRYYAAQARLEFSAPLSLPGPTGESNDLSWQGRGVFLCISPWNFPLAIFAGQVAAALVTGNTVLAKPAEQTSLVAAAAVRLLHQAGVPGDALHLLPGSGPELGEALLSDPRLAGVAFTGSTEVARLINRQLAARDSAIPVLIAETGGLNAMLVDSSALPEQVVLDTVKSAFNSAGQRCSALRVLFLQKDVADRTLNLLKGYMRELAIGDPALLTTDVGPVIDGDALEALQAHVKRMEAEDRVVARCELPAGAANGTFMAPHVIELDSIDQLEGEVFGPVLHVVRYAAKDIDRVIDQINATGYALTFGVHSRIDARAREVFARVRAGNVYVNRNMVGAVVGVQPFGGFGLSGTGPKAGGPGYLHRFVTERTLTINTSAVGGNASLLSLSEG
jgi:RHH-type transcriptional regulator, proline utilization regulon repressor / proline dehydrogenase / delta 1-pyrroline-5-carboxylate dehydrogenase